MQSEYFNLMLGEHLEAHLMVTLKYGRHYELTSFQHNHYFNLDYYNSTFSLGTVFQKRFKSGAGSTHLVDSANHVFLVPQMC